MKRPKIILISGKARSGKDTLANFMLEDIAKDNKKGIIIKYADILKFICEKYFDWDGNKDEKGRTLLQYIGTNVIRKNNADTWVNCVIELVKGFGNEFDYILISDVRFPNEIRRWKEENFDYTTIRVYRVNEDNEVFDNGLSIEQKNHPSELALDNYEMDFYISNKTNELEKFKFCVTELYKEIKKE